MNNSNVKYVNMPDKKEKTPDTIHSTCSKCGRKVFLPVSCKCNLVFCDKHRYPDQHNCSVNLVNESKKKISAENPIVRDDKNFTRLEDV